MLKVRESVSFSNQSCMYLNINRFLAENLNLWQGILITIVLVSFNINFKIKPVDIRVPKLKASQKI